MEANGGSDRSGVTWPDRTKAEVLGTVGPWLFCAILAVLAGVLETSISFVIAGVAAILVLVVVGVRRLQARKNGYRFDELGITRFRGDRIEWAVPWTEAILDVRRSPLLSLRPFRLEIRDRADQWYGVLDFDFWDVIRHDHHVLREIRDRAIELILLKGRSLAARRLAYRRNGIAMIVLGTLAAVCGGFGAERFIEGVSPGHSGWLGGVSVLLILTSAALLILGILDISHLWRDQGPDDAWRLSLERQLANTGERVVMKPGVWYRYRESQQLASQERLAVRLALWGGLALFLLTAIAMTAVTAEERQEVWPILVITGVLFGGAAALVVSHGNRRMAMALHEFCLEDGHLVVRGRNGEWRYPTPPTRAWNGAPRRSAWLERRDRYGRGRHAYSLDPRYLETLPESNAAQ